VPAAVRDGTGPRLVEVLGDELGDLVAEVVWVEERIDVSESAATQSRQALSVPVTGNPRPLTSIEPSPSRSANRAMCV